MIVYEDAALVRRVGEPPRVGRRARAGRRRAAPVLDDLEGPWFGRRRGARLVRASP